VLNAFANATNFFPYLIFCVSMVRLPWIACNALLLIEICMVVVRRRLPQGRLMLVVTEAEDLAIGMKGKVLKS